MNLVNTHPYPEYDEATLLTPAETRFEVEARLIDVKHILQKNGFAENCFVFAPYSETDYYTIEDAITDAITKVEMRKSPYSKKVARGEHRNGKSFYYCSQVNFTPKLNVEPEHIEELTGSHAGLTLHLRDTPNGDIYLQCEFCDIYDPDNGIPEDENPNAKVDDIF